MRRTISAFATLFFLSLPFTVNAGQKQDSAKPEATTQDSAKPVPPTSEPAKLNAGNKEQSTIQFTSRSTLVVLPVIVHRDGKHVGGLTKEKFTVLEDGKPQALANFEEIKTEIDKTSI